MHGQIAILRKSKTKTNVTIAHAQGWLQAYCFCQRLPFVSDEYVTSQMHNTHIDTMSAHTCSGL